MIDIKQLRQLIRLMHQHDLTELDLRDHDEQVTLKRGSTTAPPAVQIAPPMAVPPPAAATHAPSPGSATEPTAAEQGLIEIASPMVGTFYAAPTPDADAFVKVGTAVDVETVVCIIEAMKVFNEIKAEVTGTIEKVLVGNGEAVEYGQAMFLVKPN